MEARVVELVRWCCDTSFGRPISVPTNGRCWLRIHVNVTYNAVGAWFVTLLTYPRLNSHIVWFGLYFFVSFIENSHLIGMGDEDIFIDSIGLSLYELNTKGAERKRGFLWQFSASRKPDVSSSYVCLSGRGQLFLSVFVCKWSWTPAVHRAV